MGKSLRLGRRAGIGVVQAALGFCLAAGLLLAIFEPVRVEGYSMLPRLRDNERLFVDKFSFDVAPLRRGDVVVFRYPLNPRENFIKRIIGLPGDTVHIVRGSVYVNGYRLVEPYVPARFADEASYPAIRVPDGEYYVLGDHRSSSNDSRIWGCLEYHYIFGRAEFAYWPPTSFGVVH